MQDAGLETLDCVKQPVPETQILAAGGAPLRFALGAATGARSQRFRAGLALMCS
jgi:hypothetical protein